MMRIFLMFCLVFQVTFGHGFQEFTVSGGVAKPAKIEWLKGITLAGAIEAAGGVTKEGNLNEVALVRNGKRYVYDLSNETHQKLKIYTGDVIQVAKMKTVGLIRPYQTLEIQVAGVSNADKARINATYQVDSKGMLTMWKIGKIKAAGRTKSALAMAVAAAYKKAGIYEAPVFQIFSESTTDGGPQMFTVGGAVKKPGQKNWKKGMTLAGIVQAGGGATPLANLKKVKLYRNGKAYVYDLAREDHRGVRIYARDVIEVPEINLVEEGEGKVGIGPKLKAEQSIEISVAGIPDSEKGRLNATYSVSKSGDITMWKVGKIKAAGKTKAALAKEIAVAYKKAGIYDEPVFQVLHNNGGDEDFGHLRFTIGGQVRSAGGKPWKKGMTLTDAVKSAGGATPFADLKRVNLYRKGKIYKYDLTNAKDGLVKINRRDVIEVTVMNIPPGSR